MQHYFFPLLALLAGLSTADGGAAASEGGTETVPKELVQALFAGATDKGVPDIVVERVPEDLASVIHVPGQWRVLGSLVWEGSATIAATSPGKPADVHAAYRQRLLDRGWTAPETPASKATGPALLCADDGAYLVVVVAAARNADHSYVRVQYSDGSEHSPCRG